MRVITRIFPGDYLHFGVGLKTPPNAECLR
jgi:hypothetical protein